MKDDTARPHRNQRRNCGICLRKAVCMLYWGELDVRFCREPSMEIIDLLDRIAADLAPDCEFYLEEAQYVAQQAGR